MWMVSCSKRATIQGAHAVYVPRNSLPTDEQCSQLFMAMEHPGESVWALATRLKHRSGLRWGELTALQADDIRFDPRVVHVRQTVEQGQRGLPRMKLPKNGRTPTTIFAKSVVDDLAEHIERVRAERGSNGLLFPGRRGDIMRRFTFQVIWIKAADAAGWPRRRPLQRTSGYRGKGSGWRCTGAAEWSPHDLRHVAACWMLFRHRCRPCRGCREARPCRPFIHGQALRRRARRSRRGGYGGNRRMVIGLFRTSPRPAPLATRKVRSHRAVEASGPPRGAA